MQITHRMLLTVIVVLLLGIAFMGHQTSAIVSPITGYEVITDSTEDNTDNFKDLTVTCPDDKVAIGGGAGVFYNSGEGYQLIPYLVSSFMYPDDSSWFAEAVQPDDATTTWYLEVQVICANVD